MGHLRVAWVDGMREPQHPPDPDFPRGKWVDGSRGAAHTCRVALPYPAKRCGYYAVYCETCGFSAGVTTAGRVDDPTGVTLPCRPRREAQA